MSRRQIERLFKRYVGQVPTKYYLDMRLRRSRELLLQTAMSIMEIAVACVSSSWRQDDSAARSSFLC